MLQSINDRKDPRRQQQGIKQSRRQARCLAYPSRPSSLAQAQALESSHPPFLFPVHPLPFPSPQASEHYQSRAPLLQVCVSPVKSPSLSLDCSKCAASHTVASTNHRNARGRGSMGSFLGPREIGTPSRCSSEGEQRGGDS